MSTKCKEHPGRDAVFEYNGVHYCQQCKDGYQAAVRAVSRHVEPKDCFVVYAGHDIWHAIPGTGCAHWVSHQKNIQVGNASTRCLRGFTFRVPTLASHLRAQGTEVKELKDVKVGDVWVADGEGHCGIVLRIQPDPDPKHPNAQKTIVIQHDSSGQGKVAENELYWLIHSGRHGPGQGSFFRKS